MPLFTVTTTWSEDIEADSASHAAERIRNAYEIPNWAIIEAGGPIDAMGGDGVED